MATPGILSSCQCITCFEPFLVTCVTCVGQERMLGIQERRPAAPVEQPRLSPTEQPSIPALAAPASTTTEAPSQMASEVPAAQETAQTSTSAAAAATQALVPPDPLSLGRQIHVFSRAAAAEAEATRGCGPLTTAIHCFDDLRILVRYSCLQDIILCNGMQGQQLSPQAMQSVPAGVAVARSSRSTITMIAWEHSTAG